MIEKRKVIKRDGRLVDFDDEKIMNAVEAAFASVSQSLPARLRRNLVKDISISLPDTVGVEQIQDRVERWLMDHKYFQAAKAFILYREKHREDRLLRDRLNYMMEYVGSTDNAATSSEEDSNANVTLKNVANLKGETYKNLNRRLQRMWMRNKLKALFPEVASQYEKDLEHHIIYTHDEASFPVPTNYCEAVTLYPLLLEGTSTMDGLRTTPPQNLNSFCGQLVNLTFLLAAQCKGAVAFGEFFNFFDYFCVKEWGPDWNQKLDMRITTGVCDKQRTVRDSILQAFQQIVFSWNQPAGNRDFQSPFINVNYFDSNYWKALFADFCFPDGSKPEWERVSLLQKMFMKWFNAERKKTLLTFPVEGMALLTDGKDVIDKEYKEFTAEMWAEGHSFFLYLSDNPDNLASCCFSSDTKVLWKSSTKGVQLTTLKELHETPWNDDKKNLRIFHNGSWIAGKSIMLPGRQMYKVTTENGKQYIMTDNHINVTLRGEKPTDCLTTQDYLMFNTMALDAVPERDEHLTYSQGFVIGAFLGDGSFGTDIKGVIYQTIISQNRQKIEKCKEQFETALKQMNIESSINVRIDEEKHSMEISSKDLVQFITRWTHWYRGTYSYNKKLNLDCLLQSKEFRMGILDGWYNTDGGNSNRCYTTSPELAENMEALITSLGMQSVIDISDRTDETVIIKAEEFSRNYPLYCIRWYSEGNHRSNKEESKSWVKRNNSIYFKIRSIEKLPMTGEPVYCIECKNEEEPYFTLPSGLITHNCRLRNEIGHNEFSFTNGLQGVKTGSCNVITLNLNRIVQDWYRASGVDLNYLTKDNLLGIAEYLKTILERVYKYHIAYKTMLYELEEKGMLTASKAGYIDMKSLFSTIGINGFNEAAEFLGLKCSDNPEYQSFAELITGTISEENRKHSTSKFRFNTEFVPKSSGHIKPLLIGSEPLIYKGNEGQAREICAA